MVEARHGYVGALVRSRRKDSRQFRTVETETSVETTIHLRLSIEANWRVSVLQFVHGFYCVSDCFKPSGDLRFRRTGRPGIHQFLLAAIDFIIGGQELYASPIMPVGSSTF